MNDSGIHDEDWEIRFKLQELLDKFGLMEDSLVFRVDALNKALSAGYNNFGNPSQLIVDPNTWKTLQNITFKDNNLKP